MEIDSLREFIVLSECLNYTKVADRLHLTQPTLSKHISAMERELGCELLSRDRHRVELTEAGNLFANACIQIVDTFDDAQSRINEVLSYEPLKVSGIIMDPVISSIVSIAATFLDGEGCPGIVYSSTFESNGSFIDAVADGEIDIAFTYAEPSYLEGRDLAYAPMTRSQFVALVSLDCPLAKRSSVSMDDLRNYRFIKYVDSYAALGWLNIENVCKEHGYTPRTRTVLARNSTNYLSTPINSQEVIVLQSNMSQFRYLGDFAKVAIIPVSDDDAVFRVSAIYRRDNEERCKPALAAYAHARKVIINHGKSCPILLEGN